MLDDGARKYIWGLELAYSVDAAGNVTVHHADGLGSTRALTDAAGAVVQRYDTEPFGAVLANQGASTQPFRFTGEQRDDSGLYYLRARFYDPQAGRFLNRDSYPGEIQNPSSLHRFAYVQNNPVNLTDPSGESPIVVQRIFEVLGSAGQRALPALNRVAQRFSQVLRGSYEHAAATGQQAVTRDTIVLGHYPEYSELAREIGARRFQIPMEVWNRMSQAEQWAANQRFLDRAIARGSEIRLATPANAAREGTFFERELHYLVSRGFTIAEDGLRMLPPS